VDRRNMDEGWTRWVLEHYEFNLTSIHGDDVRAPLRQNSTRSSAVRMPDRSSKGYDAPSIGSIPAASAKPASS
jgi:hypothetical protein